jgi:hypothetical protein
MIGDGKRVAAGGARLQWHTIPIADIDLIARITRGEENGVASKTFRFAVVKVRAARIQRRDPMLSTVSADRHNSGRSLCVVEERRVLDRDDHALRSGLRG